MAHQLELIDGQASMAYVNTETPWHGLGFSVSGDLSPDEIMKAARLDWNVEKVPLFAEHNGKRLPTGRSALIRDRDDKVLDVISAGWEPCQNSEAFEFFSDWVREGDMTMETAGSLYGGKTVWALAKIKDGAFDVVKGDTTESFLLFSNPHQYGRSIEVRATNIRVVCNNTLTFALSKKANSMIRLNHSKKFDAEMVKETLGYTRAKTELLRDQARFLATAKCTPEQVHEYISRLFPIGEGAKRPDRTFSKPGQVVFDVVDTQPGADLAPGTFWNLANAVSYSTDHILGNGVDSRLSSAWFGRYQAKKIEALQLALEMAA
jgi:phage/plasmid-like protein (TIGR03299 family)